MSEKKGNGENKLKSNSSNVSEDIRKQQELIDEIKMAKLYGSLIGDIATQLKSMEGSITTVHDGLEKLKKEFVEHKSVVIEKLIRFDEAFKRSDRVRNFILYPILVGIVLLLAATGIDIIKG